MRSSISGWTSWFAGIRLLCDGCGGEQGSGPVHRHARSASLARPVNEWGYNIVTYHCSALCAGAILDEFHIVKTASVPVRSPTTP